MAEKRDVVVQVEVPFCVRDETLRRPGLILGWDSARMSAYVRAVVAEIEANAGQFDDCRVQAVHFGGGVASNAGAGIADIMRSVRRVCDVADDVQTTMRASIANVSGATMPFFRRAGIDRFDFEMLSLNSADFTRLNQVDNLNDLPIICDHFLHSYANDSLGFVLAYGHAVPDGEDGALNVRRTALAAARSHATQVELVCCAGELAAAEDETEAQLTEMRDVFAEYGFGEYRPLRFARPGKEDRFTLLQAAGVEQIGFGLGAVTRLDGVKSMNTRDLALYCERSADFTAITAEVQQV